MALEPRAIVGSILVLAPAAGVLAWSYGRYDGSFRDNVVFLHLTGGMALGLVVAIILSFLPAEPAFLVAFSVLPAVAIGAAANRRKWQGIPHAVFNGGALGLGCLLMTAFVLLRDRFEAIAWTPALRVLVVATVLVLLGAALGWHVGAGVLARTPFRGIGRAIVIALPGGFFVYEFLFGEAWLWAVLGLLYAGGVYAHADRTVLPRGVGENERRKRRRERRDRVET